jgi:hypothetical protein
MATNVYGGNYIFVLKIIFFVALLELDTFALIFDGYDVYIWYTSY